MCIRDRAFTGLQEHRIPAPGRRVLGAVSWRSRDDRHQRRPVVGAVAGGVVARRWRRLRLRAARRLAGLRLATAVALALDGDDLGVVNDCLLYTSPSPRDS